MPAFLILQTRFQRRFNGDWWKMMNTAYDNVSRLRSCLRQTAETLKQHDEQYGYARLSFFGILGASGGNVAAPSFHRRLYDRLFDCAMERFMAAGRKNEAQQATLTGRVALATLGRITMFRDVGLWQKLQGSSEFARAAFLMFDEAGVIPPHNSATIDSLTRRISNECRRLAEKRRVERKLAEQAGRKALKDGDAERIYFDT